VYISLENVNTEGADVCIFREKNGVSGKQTGMELVSFHSKQNRVFGLFKERLWDHMVTVQSLGIPN